MITWQSKKILSVMFAVLVGVGIILFAWFGDDLLSKKSGVVDDGSAATFRVVSQQGTNYQNTKGGIGDSSTTITESLSQDLVTAYVNTKSDESSASTMSDKDAAAFVEKVLKDKVGTAVKQYTAKDLVVIETSPAVVTRYKEEVAQAVKTLLEKSSFDELILVTRAINANDEAKLLPLQTSVNNYQLFVDTLLLIKVPSSEVTFHLYALQSYATVLSGVIDMQSILSDPVLGSQGIAKYNAGVKMILQTEQLFGKK